MAVPPRLARRPRFEEAAAALAAAAAAGQSVRIRRRRHQARLGLAGDEPDVIELRTTGLDRILEHNAGDLTAVLEAGVPLARAQERVRRPPGRCWRSTRRWGRERPRRHDRRRDRDRRLAARCATATARRAIWCSG